MKVMFVIYCPDGTNTMKMYFRLSKIQIKTILMMRTLPNENEKESNTYPYKITMLTDIKKMDYMTNAIKERLHNTNKLEHYEINEI